MSERSIISVAVPVPLRKSFDFILPDSLGPVTPGMRVRVPFGRRKMTGVVLAVGSSSEVPLSRLRAVLEILDEDAVFETDLWNTLQWVASYYLSPIGEVMETALPVLLRKGHDQRPASEARWRLTEYGRAASPDDLQRAPLQLALIERFSKVESLSAEDFRQETRSWRQAIQALVKKQWLQSCDEIPSLPVNCASAEPVVLNTAQRGVAKDLKPLVAKHEFSCSLLHGVTGSGKTEVYFAVMNEVLQRGQQVLLLVPEIGLTPQLIERINRAFSCSVTVLHSGLTDQQRHSGWWHARQGEAGIVVGTRSAVFTPFKNLGLIIVDEEHDSSLKQQDGVRYQARDVAVYRAKQANIPIVLGSATPSLESWHNAKQGRYQLLSLENRAVQATMPSITLLDLRVLPTRDGLTTPLINALTETLAAKQQVMLFLNRRGYAPVLYCKNCGQTGQCHRCDSHLTFHQRSNHLRCHHCGYEGKATGRCQHCDSSELAEVGEGTQRVEDALNNLFPDARVLRIDRDSTRRKGELEDKLSQVANHQADIVLGTQLLVKGHDFPGVTMVGVLAADHGLYSTDFRAREALFQQLLQVAGRAGRRATAGRVFIQTAFPGEPFFDFVRQHDFCGFAESLLQERRRAGFPPFGHFAVVRAESSHQTRALQFLRRLRQELPSLNGVTIMDAIPAPMERRAGRYRAQLLLSAADRSALHVTLRHGLHSLEHQQDLRKAVSAVRWSVDIDPADLY